MKTISLYEKCIERCKSGLHFDEKESIERGSQCWIGRLENFKKNFFSMKIEKWWLCPLWVGSMGLHLYNIHATIQAFEILWICNFCQDFSNLHHCDSFGMPSDWVSLRRFCLFRGPPQTDGFQEHEPRNCFKRCRYYYGNYLYFEKHTVR